MGQLAWTIATIVITVVQACPQNHRATPHPARFVSSAQPASHGLAPPRCSAGQLLYAQHLQRALLVRELAGHTYPIPPLRVGLRDAPAPRHRFLFPVSLVICNDSMVCPRPAPLAQLTWSVDEPPRDSAVRRTFAASASAGGSSAAPF